MKIYLKSILVSVLLMLLTGCGGSGDGADESNIAYFGDYDSDKVFVIDLDKMTIKATITTGDGPYGADQQDGFSVYALTRKVESLTIIDTQSLTNEGFIYLPFIPRSTDYNAQKAQSLVSGKSDPKSCIIDVATHSVGQCVGDDHDGSTITDYGGGNATGHPFWTDESHFLLLDRVTRTIDYYGSDGSLLSSLETNTTVHHILPDDAGTYYGVLEGSQTEEFPPGLVKFTVVGDAIIEEAVMFLNDDDPAMDLTIMGAHHVDMHPDGKHLYIGSDEGNLFIVDKDTMSIVDQVIAGKGVGHVTFVAGRLLTITTNHYDTFMSIFDISDPLNNVLIKELEVAQASNSGNRLQSHTSGVRPDEKYFYSAASNDGLLFEIDLETLTVSRSVNLDDGNILMGSFMWSDGSRE